MFVYKNHMSDDVTSQFDLPHVIAFRKGEPKIFIEWQYYLKSFGSLLRGILKKLFAIKKNIYTENRWD